MPCCGRMGNGTPHIRGTNRQEGRCGHLSPACGWSQLMKGHARVCEGSTSTSESLGGILEAVAINGDSKFQQKSSGNIW